jgi:putative addiction module killer protein
LGARLDVCPGYRVNCLQDRETLVLLHRGGDKSAQQKDIDKAHELAGQWHDDTMKEGKQ